MAKGKGKSVNVGVHFDDNGSLKETGNKAKAAGKDLDKAGKGAHSMDRRLKGAAQASSNSTKNFSKMSQGISGGLVPAYATLAASLFAVDAAFRALKRASDLRVQQQGMVAYGQATGLALKTMTRNLQDATKGQLDFKQAAESVAIAASAGFSGEQITAIGAAATKASITLGRDFADSYQRMIKGITKAEPELLDELGIILRLDDAMSKHSTIIGKSAEDFTAFERQTAVLNEVMRQTEEKFGAVGDAIPVNVMGQLGTKFTEITDSFLEGIAPIAEFFGSVLVNNTGAAVAALGVFAASILKQVIPSAEAMTLKMQEAALARKAAFGDLKGAGGAFVSGIKGAYSSATATKSAQGLAGGALKDVKSKGLSQLRSGGALSGSQKGGLTRALKMAEKQYAQHGQVVTGMFKGKDAATLKSLRLTLTAMDGGWKGFVAKTRLGTGQLVSTFKIGTNAMKAIWKVTTTQMSAMAARMGRAMNRALGIIGWIGMIFMAKDAIIGMWESLDKILMKIGETMAKVGKWLSKVTGGRLGGNLEAWGQKTKDKGEDMKEEYEAKRNARKRINFVKGETDRIKQMREEAGVIAAGTTGGTHKASQLLGDLGGGSSVRSMAALKGKGYSPEQIKKIADEQREHFKIMAALDPAYEDVLKKLDAGKWKEAGDLADKLTEKHSNHTKALKDLSSQQEGFNKLVAAAVLKSKAMTEFGQSLVNIQKSMKDLDPTDDSYQTMRASLLTMYGPEAIKGVKDYASALAFINGQVTDMEANLLAAANAQLNFAQAKMGVAGAAGGPGVVGDYWKKQAQTTGAFAASTAARAKWDEEKVIRDDALAKHAPDSSGFATLKAQYDAEEIHVLTLEKTSERYKMLNSDLGELAMAGTNAFADSMQSGLEGVITGTKSLSDAFKDMAKSILASLAKVIAKQLMMRMLMGAFGGTSFGTDFLGLPKPESRYGGILSSPGYRSYRTGAIASGPNSGYAATLHGTEAVVPLGNDRSIPVKMKGGAGSTNNTNVTVNVAQDGQSSTSITGESRGAALGQVIANAIDERLQDEQRPGGMLNPGG